MYTGKQNSVKLAYLAGIIDGEGTIRIERKGTPTKKGHSPQYLIHVTAHNSNPALNKWIDKHFGGTHMVRYENKSGRRPMYRTVWVSRKARAIILAIIPFLVLKGKQAKIALKLQSRLHYGRKRLNSKELKIRQRLFERCKKLQKFGHAPSGNE